MTELRRLPLLLITLAISGCDSSNLVINEIEYNPAGDDAGKEWLELYNKGDGTASVHGWTVSTKSHPSAATLPDWAVPSGAYLVVVLGHGNDDPDFSDGTGRFHVQRDSEFVDNDADSIGLYAGPPEENNLRDYVAYDFVGRATLGPVHGHAIRTGQWVEDLVFDDGLFTAEGETLGRDFYSSDTDTPDDWMSQGGLDASHATPGIRNYTELAYRLGNGDDPCKSAEPQPPMSADLRRWVARLMEALNQIHDEHRDLLGDLDPGNGAGPPRVQPNGDVTWGNLRFRAHDDLNPNPEANPDKPDALGKACVSDQPGDEVKILIDPGLANEVWKLKDVAIHELVHAALQRSPDYGFWRPPAAPLLGESGERRQLNSDVRDEVLFLHEAIAYLIDIELLDRILSEFPQFRDDIEERRRFKVEIMQRQLRTYLSRHRGRLRQSRHFGDDLEELIETFREQFIRAKASQAQEDNNVTDKERRDIRRVGRALGLLKAQVDGIIDDAAGEGDEEEHEEPGED